jgi:hypothetical protein
MCGHWIMLRKIFDICVMGNDQDLALLRELLRFKGAGAKGYLRERPSSMYPLPSLLVALAEMRIAEPEAIRHILYTGMVATVLALEEKVGLDHPTTLLAWFNVSWHFNRPIAPEIDLAGRYKAILAQAEAHRGSKDPVTIGILYDLTQVTFHDGSDRQHKAALAEDLLERTSWHVHQGPPGNSSQILKAHGFATVVLGLFALEDGRLERCKSLFEVAMEWYSRGDHFSQMYVEIIDADLRTMISTWRNGGELKGLKLTFLRPRCIDTEREEMR